MFVENNVMSSGIENRERMRIECATTDEPVAESGDVVIGKVKDISLSGMFCEMSCPDDMPIPDGIPLPICLLMTHGGSRLRIETMAKMVRREAAGAAFTFAEPLVWWPLFTIFKKTVAVVVKDDIAENGLVQ